MFIDRGTELETLTDCYERDTADLVVVYGRRRLGKTAVARRSLSDDDAIYYQATETRPELQLETFAELATEVYPVLSGVRREWEYLMNALADQNAVIVIDEFPYLIESDSAIPSRFQRAWDTHIADTGATLVLVGSSISMIEDHVLAGDSPLHGRATARIDLSPLTPGDAWEFYPGYDAESAITAWAVFGGTPHYLRALNPEKPLAENVQDVLLSPQGLLHEEPEFILRTELTQPQTYFSVLQAMARGNRAQNEIAQGAGADSQNIGTYLNKLERLRIITRDVPVTERPARSHRGRYRLADPLFRFWFRFVYGQASRIELVGEDAYEQIVMPELADHVSPIFEELCQRALPTLLAEFTYRNIGGWWYKEHEVDVVGLTEEVLITGECKFQQAPVDPGVLRDLETTTENIKWTLPDGTTPVAKYALFSRKGFTKDLIDIATDRDDVHLFELDAIIEALGTD
jgi:AAA+ ATPase superfamily predicted ATPase